jgi:predicted transcriptional regulator
MSQRDLADAAGVPQPAIARIESGRVQPRVDTLDRLLEACGWDLEVTPRLGIGIDRTVMRQLLRLNEPDRFQLVVDEARLAAQWM